MSDRNFNYKLPIIGILLALVSLASPSLQDGVRLATRSNRDQLSRRTINGVKPHFSKSYEENPNEDYITFPIAPNPKAVNNKNQLKTNLQIDGDFITLPIAPPPGAKRPKVPYIPRVQISAKSTRPKDPLKRRKEANNFPVITTNSTEELPLKQKNKNKKKGHKRQRARARAHKKENVSHQRDAPEHRLMHSPQHESNRQTDFHSPLNSGPAALGLFSDRTTPQRYVTEDAHSECIECPVKHVIVAPRGMACAPLVLPPVRACRKKDEKGPGQRVHVEMASRLMMYPEGSHNVALNVRAPSGRLRTCIFELIVQVRKCPLLPAAPEFGQWSCDHHLSGMDNIWGSQCLFECNRKFATIGEALTTCDEVDGVMRWSKQPPKCLVKVPPTPKAGSCVNETVLLHNGHAVFAKPPEFSKANGGDAEVHCRLDGVALTVGVHQNLCEASDEQLNIGTTCTYHIHVIAAGVCSLPRTAINGLVDCGTQKPGGFPAGTICTYGCKEKFVVQRSFRGNMTTECQPSSHWSNSNPPQCHPKIPPEPLPNSCQDSSYEVQDLDQFEVPVPGFVTASGQKARVSCSLRRVVSYGRFANNCTAWDPELGLWAACAFKVTVKGIQCPPLGSLINGQMTCSSLEGNYRCDLSCNKGYRLPSSYKFLERGYIECDSVLGGWDFQKGSPATRLPDCLGELPSTSLSSSLTFNVSVLSCEDKKLIGNLSEYVKSSLLRKNEDTCLEVSCNSVTHRCLRDVLVTSWKVMATYTPPEKDYDYTVPEAEELIEKLHMDTQQLINQNARFLITLSEEYSAELLGDTLRISHIDLICEKVGYAVDPSSYRCVECPTGYYQSGNECTLCPANTYQDQTGQTDCVQCLAGTTSTSGAHSRENCHAKDTL